MGQPKAEWERHGAGWRSIVGRYELVVCVPMGSIGIREILTRRPSTWDIVGADMNSTEAPRLWLWQDTVPVPCDLADLMRLAESELARRLREAAETMDGSELVAPPRASIGVDPGCAEAAVIATVDARTGRLLSIDSLKVRGREVVAERCIHCEFTEGHAFDCPVAMHERFGVPQLSAIQARVAVLRAARDAEARAVVTLREVHCKTCGKGATVKLDGITEPCVCEKEADCEAGLRTRLVGANGQVRGYSKRRESDAPVEGSRDWALAQLDAGATVSATERVEYQRRNDLHGAIEMRVRLDNGTLLRGIVAPSTSLPDFAVWRALR